VADADQLLSAGADKVSVNSAAVAEPEVEVSAAVCLEELERQLARFHTLTGRWPTHLDSHHNAHRSQGLDRSFVKFGERETLLLLV